MKKKKSSLVAFRRMNTLSIVWMLVHVLVYGVFAVSAFYIEGHHLDPAAAMSGRFDPGNPANYPVDILGVDGAGYGILAALFLYLLVVPLVFTLYDTWKFRRVISPLRRGLSIFATGLATGALVFAFSSQGYALFMWLLD